MLPIERALRGLADDQELTVLITVHRVHMSVAWLAQALVLDAQGELTHFGMSVDESPKRARQLACTRAADQVCALHPSLATPRAWQDPWSAESLLHPGRAPALLGCGLELIKRAYS